MTEEQIRAAGYVLVNGAYVKSTSDRGSKIVIERFTGSIGEPGFESQITVGGIVSPTPKLKRIRQSSKPVMNELETEFYATIKDRYPNFPKPRPQSVTFKLANGVRYTPDFFTTCWPRPMGNGQHKAVAWEVKGPWFTDDAAVKLKVFAAEYQDILVILAWKDNGAWQQQEVLP